MASKKHKAFRIVWFSLVAVFLVWQWTIYQSRDLPKDTFLESSTISVIETEDFITFSPKSVKHKSEIIFYQGGLVDSEAYAPLCRSIAENGYVCHLIKCDWRMPVWNYEDIKSLFDLKSGAFILGGHSQGAKMAAQFVYENPDDIKGLFLIGTSHPRDFDLSNLEIPTIKVYGELDGLASVEEVEINKALMPSQSKFVLIEGGNHSQFGYMGHLLTDDDAIITLSEQQNLTLEALLLHFEKVENQLN